MWNACFSPSSNSGGIANGGTCATTYSVAPGDDATCAAGLVCVNRQCQSPALFGMSPAASSASVQSVAVRPTAS